MNLAGRERWRAFAAELEEVTGMSTGYRENGALVVAADRDDVEELRRLHDFQRSLGLDAEWLTPSRCRELEPGLSPRMSRRHPRAPGRPGRSARGRPRPGCRGGRAGAQDGGSSRC